MKILVILIPISGEKDNPISRGWKSFSIKGKKSFGMQMVWRETH